MRESDEAESLSGGAREDVNRLKRSYVDLCLALLAELDAQADGERPNRQVAAYTLFGMMNWIYTWYNPSGPVGVEELAESIGRLFINGYAAEVQAR